jgi:hypothetical protein
VWHFEEFSMNQARLSEEMLEKISRLLVSRHADSLNLLVHGTGHEPRISCAIKVRHSCVLFFA